MLDQLALGDAYVLVEGPIGPLFVAFGRDGISLVERAGDDRDAGDFEQMFRATFGRSVRRVARAPATISKSCSPRGVLWKMVAGNRRALFVIGSSTGRGHRREKHYIARRPAEGLRR